MSSPQRALHAGLPPAQRRWAGLAITMGIVLAVLDGAISNVGLPVIASELQVDPSAAVWVATGYQLSFGAAILPFASLGDILGARRVLLGGLLIYSTGALFSALSPSFETLVAARILQGVGAAAIMSLNGALIFAVYPSAQVGRAIAFNMMASALAQTVAPALAVAILSVANWHWLFACSAPLGILAFLVARVAVPAGRRHARAFDWTGAILCTATFVGVSLGFSALGKTHSFGLGCAELLAAAGIGILLVAQQRRVATPMLPLDLFGNRFFSLALGTSVFAFMAQIIAQIGLPFLLQHELGLSLADTGLIFMAWPLTMLVCAPLAGYLADRYDPGVICACGLVATAAGLLMLFVQHADEPLARAVAGMVLSGFGFALFQSPNARAIMMAAPVQRSGAASGMMGVARMAGLSFGSVAAGLVFDADLVTGARMTLGIAAAVALLGAAISALRLKKS